MLALLMTILAAAEPAVPAELDAFLEDFAEHRVHLTALEAKFVQINFTTDFRGETDRLEKVGTLVYVHPRRLVFRYDDIVMLIDRTRFYEYDPAIGQLQITSLGNDPQMEALFLGFEENLDALREAYALTLFDVGGDSCADFGLALNPKDSGDPEAPPLFEEVRLYLRKGDYLPCRVYTVNDPEASVDLQFSELRVNPDLDPALTQIQVPEGTVITQDDKYLRTVGEGGESMPPAVLAPIPAGDDAP